MPQSEGPSRWLWVAFFIMGYIVGTGSIFENIYRVFAEMSNKHIVRVTKYSHCRRWFSRWL
jgi:hypothetical protein